MLFVAFAARSAVFSALLTTDDVEALPPVATLLDVATRQIARAGGPPEGADRPAVPADPKLTPLLPGDPDPRFGLSGAVTGGGPDELPAGLGISPEVVSFLNRRSSTVVRAWTNPATGLAAAVSLTSYPYEVFAGAALAATADDSEVALQPSAANADVADVLTFTGRGDKAGEVGAALRRGRISAVILVQPGRGGQPEAEAVVSDLVHQLDQRLPAQASALYRFPPPPSTIAGLALTAAIVTAGAAACIGVGRARAWTLRRADAPGAVALAAPGVGSVATGTWSGSGTAGRSGRRPSGATRRRRARARRRWFGRGSRRRRWSRGRPSRGGSAREQVTDLDGDARALRRRGLVVVVAQLVALERDRHRAGRRLRLAGRGGRRARARRRSGLHQLVAAARARGDRTAGSGRAVHPAPARRRARRHHLAGRARPRGRLHLQGAALPGPQAHPRPAAMVGPPRPLAPGRRPRVHRRRVPGGRARRRAVPRGPRARPGGHPAPAGRGPPASGAVPALLRRRHPPARDHRLGPAAVLRAAVVPGPRPVRGGRGLGAGHLRPGRRRRAGRAARWPRSAPPGSTSPTTPGRRRWPGACTTPAPSPSPPARRRGCTGRWPRSWPPVTWPRRSSSSRRCRPTPWLAGGRSRPRRWRRPAQWSTSCPRTSVSCTPCRSAPVGAWPSRPRIERDEASYRTAVDRAMALVPAPPPAAPRRAAPPPSARRRGCAVAVAVAADTSPSPAPGAPSLPCPGGQPAVPLAGAPPAPPRRRPPRRRRRPPLRPADGFSSRRAAGTARPRGWPGPGARSACIGAVTKMTGRSRKAARTAARPVRQPSSSTWAYSARTPVT